MKPTRVNSVVVGSLDQDKKPSWESSDMPSRFGKKEVHALKKSEAPFSDVRRQITTASDHCLSVSGSKAHDHLYRRVQGQTAGVPALSSSSQCCVRTLARVPRYDMI